MPASSNAKLAGRCWRLVEAQHRVSTLKLVDTLDEQARLEQLIEATKPTVPPDCRHLDPLLSTPFRYGAPYPRGSRFRRAGMTDGVFYASEQVETAVAEMAFHRLLFFADSPATPFPQNAAEYTAFAAGFRSDRALDLTRPPHDANETAWTDPVDYEACQALADAARGGADLIRYRSARDPERGCNIAILSARAFAEPRPLERQSWRIRLSRFGVQAICEFPDRRLGFDRAAFARDPRIAALDWQR